jgi:hypothetical protein
MIFIVICQQNVISAGFYFDKGIRAAGGLRKRKEKRSVLRLRETKYIQAKDRIGISPEQGGRRKEYKRR